MAGSWSTAEVHHAALRKYLEAHLLKEQDGQTKQRRSAMDKLMGLSKQHFLELSTDVYDEMSRRLLDSPDVPFLPVRDDFHPKRNQARQKLATLPTSRFKDLASDVFFELQRRCPELDQLQRRPSGAEPEQQQQRRPSGAESEQQQQRRPSGAELEQQQQRRPSGAELNQQHRRRPSGAELEQQQQQRPSGAEINQQHQRRPSGAEINQQHQRRPSGAELNQQQRRRPSGAEVEQQHQRRPSGAERERQHQRPPSGAELEYQQQRRPSGAEFEQQQRLPSGADLEQLRRRTSVPREGAVLENRRPQQGLRDLLEELRPTSRVATDDGDMKTQQEKQQQKQQQRPPPPPPKPPPQPQPQQQPKQQQQHWNLGSASAAPYPTGASSAVSSLPGFAAAQKDSITVPQEGMSAAEGPTRAFESTTTTAVPQQQTAIVQGLAYVVQRNADGKHLASPYGTSAPPPPIARSAHSSATSDDLVSSRRSPLGGNSSQGISPRTPVMQSDNASAAAGVIAYERNAPGKLLSGGLGDRTQVDLLANTSANFANLDSLLADLGSLDRVTKPLVSTSAKHSDVRQDVPGPRNSSEEVSQLHSPQKSNVEMREWEENLDCLKKRVAELERSSQRSRGLQDELETLEEVNTKQTDKLRQLEQVHYRALLELDGYRTDFKDSQLQAQQLKSKLSETLGNFENLREEKQRDIETAAKLKQENARIRKELSNTMETVSWLSQPSDRFPAVSYTPPVSLTYVAAVAQADYALTPQENGLMDLGKIGAYQATVDELLKAARTESPTGVLMAMKAVVVSCKSITEDLDRYNPAGDTDSSDHFQELKANFAATLSGLFAAAKAYAAARNTGRSEQAGAFPGDPLYVSAGNLTAAIFEFIKLLRIKD